MKDWPNINGCEECAAPRARLREVEEERDRLEGTMQTALDLLSESASEKQSYDFNARRIVFLESELRRRAKEGVVMGEIHCGDCIHKHVCHLRRETNISDAELARFCKWYEEDYRKPPHEYQAGRGGINSDS